LLPVDIAEAEVGVYSACYVGLFMVCIEQPILLGIEPFFSAILMIKPQTYAMVTILCHLWIIYIIVGNRFADLLNYDSRQFVLKR
jgi:hypothetical protein